jgi:hypothetical protein
MPQAGNASEAVGRGFATVRELDAKPPGVFAGFKAGLRRFATTNRDPQHHAARVHLAASDPDAHPLCIHREKLQRQHARYNIFRRAEPGRDSIPLRLWRRRLRW